jgi:hypothetical protein
MNRFWVLMVVLLYAVMLLAQGGSASSPGANTSAPPYQPAVPPPSTVNAYGGWPVHAGASTAAGSALNGMASAISAAGDYNLATSAAAVNMTQAQRNEIQNRQLATNTYFEMRATNRAAREAEQGPKPTMEQMARLAHEGVPKPLNPGQMDPVSGGLDWPTVLQTPGFDAQRREVDQLFVKRATYGGLAYSDQTKLRQTIDAMFGELKTQIREIPTPDYLASRKFLQSLAWTGCKSSLD